MTRDLGRIQCQRIPGPRRMTSLEWKQIWQTFRKPLIVGVLVIIGSLALCKYVACWQYVTSRAAIDKAGQRRAERMGY